MQHSMRIPNGILHYSSTDAIFRSLEGSPIAMEFHHYCGPAFFSKEEEAYYPEGDTPEGSFLWDQFDGWWKAKGKDIYRS